MGMQQFIFLQSLGLRYVFHIVNLPTYPYILPWIEKRKTGSAESRNYKQNDWINTRQKEPLDTIQEFYSSSFPLLVALPKALAKPLQ